PLDHRQVLSRFRRQENNRIAVKPSAQLLLQPTRRMRATLQAVLTATFLLGCSRQDPIDRLMVKVENQSVPSYVFKPIELPDTASPEQCISVLTSRGQLHLPKILQVRHAHASFGSFTAVLLDSNDGQKIVLLRPWQTNGWYFRIYDAK